MASDMVNAFKAFTMCEYYINVFIGVVNLLFLKQTYLPTYLLAQHQREVLISQDQWPLLLQNS